MSNPAITMIFVSYNSAETIGDALDSAREGYDAGLTECIVVDNVSQDTISELITNKYPWVEFIQSETNVGYGRGCNLGLERAKTQYVLFMNPDAVLPVDDLKILLDFMNDHPKAGLAAPAIIESKGSYQGAGPLPTPMGLIYKALGIRRKQWQHDPILPDAHACQADWVCGAVMMARRKVIKELQGFDPRFFLYYEETDLCKRVLQSGYEIWTVGQAVARHISGASAQGESKQLFGGCIAQHFFPSRFYYLIKHHGYIPAMIAETCDLIILLSRGFLPWLRGRGRGEVRARLSAPILRQPPRPDGFPRRRH